MREDAPPRNCDSQGCHLRTRVWIDVSPSHCTPIYTWENHAPDQSLLMYDSPLSRKCNLVLWWYQMYLIAENPKCLFWITVYHVPNLDPRSWIRPASAEFCFFLVSIPTVPWYTRFSKNLITTNLSTENHIPGEIHWNWLGFYLYRFTRTVASPPNAAWPRSFQHTHTAMRQVWLVLAGCFAQAVAVEDRWNNSLLGCRWTKLGLVETTYVGLYLQNANSLYPLMSGNYPSINTPKKVLAMSLILSNGHSVPCHSRFSRIYWLLSTTIF